jgi:hypothetical protein
MPKPFESLRGRLLEAGIAPRNVDRYVTELTDHLADLVPELQRQGMSRRAAEAAALGRIGDLDTLAAAMVARPELRSWTVRAPWAAFLLAPLTGFAAMVAAGLALVVLMVQRLHPNADIPMDLPAWVTVLKMMITFLDLYMLPLMLIWTILIVALRQRTGVLWPLLGAAAVAMIGGALQLDVVLPNAAGAHGEISVGMGLLPPYAEFGNSLIRILTNLAATVPAYLAIRARDQRIAA